MQNKNTPTEGQNSDKLEAESALPRHDLLGVFVTARLKNGINGEPRQGWVETVDPLTIRGESGTLYECEGTPTVVINPPDRKVCRCERPAP